MPVCQLSAVSSRLSCTCKGGCAHLEFVWLLLLCHVLPAIPKSRIVESGLQGTTTHRQCNTSPPNRSSWTTQLPPPHTCMKFQMAMPPFLSPLSTWQSLEAGTARQHTRRLCSFRMAASTCAGDRQKQQRQQNQSRGKHSIHICHLQPLELPCKLVDSTRTSYSHNPPPIANHNPQPCRHPVLPAPKAAPEHPPATWVT